MVKVSIIVPIYNQEKLLANCLSSIQKQSYDEFECILVNDGSTDTSSNIAKMYAKMDSRFKYFEIKNSGVSVARNIGIKNASAELIVFVDSDDSVKEDYIESLVVPMLQQKDLALNIISTVPVRYGEQYEKIDDVLSKFNRYYDFQIFNSPWAKCYVKSRIQHLFVPGLALGEDLLFVLSYMLDNEIKYVRFENKEIYNYTIDSASESLTSNVNIRKMDRYLQLFSEMSKLSNRVEIDEVIKIQSKSFLLDLLRLYDKNRQNTLEWIATKYNYIVDESVSSRYHIIMKLLFINKHVKLRIRLLSILNKLK